MSNIFKIIIKGYQVIFSPWFFNSCRFTPTCSNYAIEAIEKYGSAKGTWFAVKRLMKCHPFHSGGIDPLK